MATAANEESLSTFTRNLRKLLNNFCFEINPALRSVPPQLRKAIIIVLVLEKF